MKYSDQSFNLRIELDTKHCELRPDEIRHLEQSLSPLRRLVGEFPVSDLYITIEYHVRSHDYRVKTALVLTGRTLTTGDLSDNALSAFERCVSKLVHRVGAYKRDLEAGDEVAKHQKGTHQEIIPADQLDFEHLQEAVDSGDYGDFRRTTYVYEEAVRKRIGRWIQRYPEVEVEIDDRLKLADIVEEVFLNAFERFEDRPRDIRFGDWLEHLIDPSIKLLMEHRSEELENINFVRSLHETSD